MAARFVLLLGLAWLAACGRPANLQPIELESPAAPGSGEPRLTVDPAGGVLLSWLEPAGNEHRLMYARLGDAVFDEPREVARGADWFVNWADFPSVVPLTNELWAAHWLIQREGGPYAYDVAVAVSRDAGASWQAAVTPHDDRTAAEHGFVSLFPLGSGVAVAWLDGRASTAGHQPMRLQTAVLDRDGAVLWEHPLDERVCDCCQTDVATAAGGPVLVYRGRSAEEIRDIYRLRFVDGTWSAPSRVAEDGWEIAGCPVNGPAIAAAENLVVAAWFSAAGGRRRVRLAYSADSGESFEPALDIDEGGVFGRVDVALLAGGDAVVSWLAGEPLDAAQLRLRRVGRDGRLGPIVPLAQIGASRSVGFPQLAIDALRLILAWTEPGPPSRLRIIAVEPPGL